MSENENSLSEEDAELVESLTEKDINKIEQWLLKNITSQWQKVAMVVIKAIEESDKQNELTEVPDIFFRMCIEKLVEEGKIVSQGNIKNMRSSEIKNA